MEGFRDDLPITAKTIWAAAEVVMTNGSPTTYGLHADVVRADGSRTHWFVPWSALSYVKQDLPAVIPTDPMPVPTKDPGPKPPTNR
jgi:hypothetical protein